jgi:hypothetical protein
LRLAGYAMKCDDAANLLEQIGVLRSRCDLDLLLFFARHPTALLTSEQLATWLGHELRAIAASLDVLLDARLVERTQNPTLAARMYVFRPDSPGNGWLPRLLQVAKTRGGRLALIEALRSTRHNDSAPSNAREATRAPALSIVPTLAEPGLHDESTPDDRKVQHG